MNKLFTLISATALTGFIVSSFFAGNVQAQEKTIASLAPESAWSVKAIGGGTENGYCALSRSYAQNLILTLGQNVLEEYSLAIDFIDGTLNANKAYGVTLQPGPGQIRAYEMMPASARALVIRLGYDDSFLQSLKDSGVLKVEMDGKQYHFDVNGFTKAQQDLQGCMQKLKGSSGVKTAQSGFSAQKVEDLPPMKTPKIEAAPSKSITIAKTESIEAPRVPEVKAEEKVEEEKIATAPKEAPAKPIVMNKVSARVSPAVDVEEEAKVEAEKKIAVEAERKLEAEKIAAQKLAKEKSLEIERKAQNLAKEMAEKRILEENKKAKELAAKKLEEQKQAEQKLAAEAERQAKLEAQKEAERVAKQEAARKLAEEKMAEQKVAAEKAAEVERQAKLEAQKVVERMAKQKTAKKLAEEKIVAQKVAAEKAAEVERQAKLEAQKEAERIAKQKTAEKEAEKLKAETAAREAEDLKLASVLEAQKEKPETLDKITPESTEDSTAEIEKIRAEMKELEKENRQLYMEAKEAQRHIDLSIVNTGNDALKKIREYEKKYEAAQMDNLALSKEIEELRRIKEDGRLEFAAGDWDLEKSTERYNEAEREIKRLGMLLEQQRSAHRQEKIELEGLLFDPAVTDKEQRRRLAELELKLARAEEQLRASGRSVPASTSSVYDNLTDMPAAPAPTVPRAPVEERVDIAAVSQSSVYNTIPSIVESQRREKEERAALIPVERAPVSRSPVEEAVISATPAVTPQRAAHQFNKGKIQQLLNKAGIGVNGIIAERGVGQYQWNAGQLVGHARVQKGNLNQLVQSYLAQEKQSCAGDFASLPASNISQGSAFEVACITPTQSMSSSVIFTQQGDEVIMIGHKISADDMDVAIDARDRIAGTL